MLTNTAPKNSSFSAVINEVKINGQQSLAAASYEQPLLIVFLRHLGCTFCREATQDIVDQKEAIEAKGLKIVMVHMGKSAIALDFFEKYGLENTILISDPTKQLYRAFDLKRGTLGQLFGFKVWIRGFMAGIVNRHGIGRLQGDGLQMPGTFVLSNGEIVEAYRHKSAADRPNYLAIADCKCG
jgi:peroxiredoxin